MIITNSIDNWILQYTNKFIEEIHNDMEKYVFERHELLKENPFDKTIANAIANENVELTINKNKSEFSLDNLVFSCKLKK